MLYDVKCSMGISEPRCHPATLKGYAAQLMMPMEYPELTVQRKNHTHVSGLMACPPGCTSQASFSAMCWKPAVISRLLASSTAW